MNTATVISEEGYVAIPADLQERYGLKPGMVVEFDLRASVLTIRRKLVCDMERARTVLDSAAKEPEGKTVEEWLEWYRGPVELPPEEEIDFERMRSVLGCAKNGLPGYTSKTWLNETRGREQE